MYAGEVNVAQVMTECIHMRTHFHLMNVFVGPAARIFENRGKTQGQGSGGGPSVCQG